MERNEFELVTSDCGIVEANGFELSALTSRLWRSRAHFTQRNNLSSLVHCC